MHLKVLYLFAAGMVLTLQSLIIIFLFIYSLFNNACSSSDYIALNERMVMNNELERMQKEVVMA
jgi:hypothetical protein